jgi:hypothetical protein
MAGQAYLKPTFSRRRKPLPRRSILSAAERESLLALPDTNDDLIRYYTFSETDLGRLKRELK